MAPDQITALAGRQLSLKSRIRARRLLELLPTRLHKDEEVLHLATASRGDSLVVATNRRLIVLGSAEPEEIAYERMMSFASGTERRKPFIKIQTDSGDIVVKGLGGSFEEVCALVHTRMWDVSLDRIREPAPVESIRRAAGGIV